MVIVFIVLALALDDLSRALVLFLPFSPATLENTVPSH
jgi:hypothetical protein